MSINRTSSSAFLLVDEWAKIGVHATQSALPTGPWFAAMRQGGDFDVVVEANCNSIVNPVLDTQKYLPHDVFVENYGFYKDPIEADLYDKMVREVDPVKQRVLMRAYERQIVDVEAHEFPMLWWERIMVYQSYVKGWKIGPSHYKYPIRIWRIFGWTVSKTGRRARYAL